MSSWKPVVTIIGLIGCSIGETPPSDPSEALPSGPSEGTEPEPAVPDPGAITEVPTDTIGVLNASSENHGRVVTQYDGACGVDVPLPEDVVPASGVHLNLHPVDCPPSMRNPAFQGCTESLLVRISAEACECQPLTGNPPPLAQPVACPKG